MFVILGGGGGREGENDRGSVPAYRRQLTAQPTTPAVRRRAIHCNRIEEYPDNFQAVKTHTLALESQLTIILPVFEH